jgi:hypothetical protein
VEEWNVKKRSISDSGGNDIDIAGNSGEILVV